MNDSTIKSEPSGRNFGVLAAISKVMATLAKTGISKDRKNDQQGYKFRGIDDVYNALASALVDASLVIVPSFTNRQQLERTTAKGNALFYTTVEARFTLYSTVDGTSVDAGPFYGEAMDSADKSSNKAMSAAYKYMAMEVFCIPTQGDNDADSTTHELAPTPWTAELKDLAVDAAKRGTTGYREFWDSLSKETRSVLVQTPDHDEYKRLAASHDKKAA